MTWWQHCFIIAALYGQAFWLQHMLTYHNNNNFVLPDRCVHMPVEWYGGFKDIVADSYWFYVAVHGSIAESTIFSYVDFITDLKPHYTTVYRYAAIWLLTRWHDTTAATYLLEKSLYSSVNNADWRIYFYLAHIQYALHNKKQAHYLLSLAEHQARLAGNYVTHAMPRWVQNVAQR